MARNLTASDRSALIRLASTLEKGSEERKAILKGLDKFARSFRTPEDKLEWVEEALFQRGFRRHRRYPGVVVERDGSASLRMEGEGDPTASLYEAAKVLKALGYKGGPGMMTHPDGSTVRIRVESEIVKEEIDLGYDAPRAWDGSYYGGEDPEPKYEYRRDTDLEIELIPEGARKR